MKSMYLVTRLQRLAIQTNQDAGCLARKVIKGKFFVAPELRKQARFIARRDLVGLPMRGPQGRLP